MVGTICIRGWATDTYGNEGLALTHSLQKRARLRIMQMLIMLYDKTGRALLLVRTAVAANDFIRSYDLGNAV